MNANQSIRLASEEVDILVIASQSVFGWGTGEFPARRIVISNLVMRFADLGGPASAAG
jgi:hypothetical protein